MNAPWCDAVAFVNTCKPRTPAACAFDRKLRRICCVELALARPNTNADHQNVLSYEESLTHCCMNKLLFTVHTCPALHCISFKPFSSRMRVSAADINRIRRNGRIIKIVHGRTEFCQSLNCAALTSLFRAGLRARGALGI